MSLLENPAFINALDSDLSSRAIADAFGIKSKSTVNEYRAKRRAVGMRVCSTPGCPTIYDGKESQCQAHRRAGDRRRGTAKERGYTGAGHRAFRAEVLERDEICVLCEAAPSTVADHYPMSRRELVEYGADPNSSEYGRGLCHRCHSIETANNPEQRGGWNNRD